MANVMYLCPKCRLSFESAIDLEEHNPFCNWINRESGATSLPAKGEEMPHDWCECQHPDHFDSGKDEHTYGAHVRANVTMHTGARFCAKCAAYHAEASRTSTSGSASEVTEAIDELVKLEESLGRAVQKTDIFGAREIRDKADAARSRLEGMFREQSDGFEEAVQERIASARAQWEDEGWPFEWVVATALREKLKASEATVREQQQEIERLRRSFVCGVCGGSGKPTSGLPCICGGIGTEQAETHGLRVECFRLERELASLKEEQLTPEEAQTLLDDASTAAPRYEVWKRALRKLRSLSSKGTEEK